MTNKRVLLLSAKKLFGESIEQTLSKVQGLEIAGHWPVDDELLQRLECSQADFVVITDDGLPADLISRLTTQILDRFPDLPVLRVTLESNHVQIFSSHLVPARRDELVDLIQHLPVKRSGPPAESSSAQREK